jgi:hypothetical protein
MIEPHHSLPLPTVAKDKVDPPFFDVLKGKPTSGVKIMKPRSIFYHVPKYG